MKSHYSLAIIGAGPAGMSAAVAAERCSIDTVVFDQQTLPGGQIYRGLANPALADISLLGSDYLRGQKLVDKFVSSNIDYIPAASVWNIDNYCDDGFEIGVLIDGINHWLRADKLLIATGAQERPMPIPGWELPGVMTAGAGQILLKDAAAVPDGGVVLAGSGPLLLLLANQYLRASVKIGALLDTTPPGALSRGFRHLPRALLASDYLLKGAKMMVALRRARVPIYKNVAALRAAGDSILESVQFESDGKTQTLATTALLLHQGVIPGIHFPQQVGCELLWNAQQHCWQPQVDTFGACIIPGVYMAGDGSAIVGAKAAALQGEASALEIARQLDAIDAATRDARSHPLRRALRRELSIRPFLDALYRPSSEFLLPSDNTLICRCEEVTAGEIRTVTKLGCPGPNQAKAFTRCGMGPCQGRQCGPAASELIANERGVDIAEVGYYRARPPLAPITLGQLASSEN